MPDTQLHFAIGLPCFTILTSLVISMVSFFNIRDSINEIQPDVRGIRSDIKDIVGKLGTMDVELGKLMDKLR